VAYSILQKSVAKSRLLENAIDSRMRIKTITYSDVLTKALPVLLARTFAHHYKLLKAAVGIHGPTSVTEEAGFRTHQGLTRR
jgi:hypothetical protein